VRDDQRVADGHEALIDAKETETNLAEPFRPTVETYNSIDGETKCDPKIANDQFYRPDSNGAWS
jgi:hypothetical protein